MHRLHPILDKDGILHVGGRLSQDSLAHAVKHPVLLPKKGYLKDLIVRHFHQRTGHQGRARTHAEICLSGIWKIDGSSIVGHHISKCVTCPRKKVIRVIPYGFCFKFNRGLVCRMSVISSVIALSATVTTLAQLVISLPHGEY